MPTRTGEETAVELVEELRRGRVGSRELTERALARLARANGRLNAVVYLAEQEALTAADAADAARAAGELLPLAGLPVTVKDSIAVAGMPWESGSFARAGTVADRDATLAARLRAAGAVVVAKTAVPEYTWSYETESARQGRTVNPYDPERTCGGSSGGEAAVLAVDASPVGLGTDGLGSVRVPSHFCGVFGLRPTAGLLPETGVWPTTRDTGMLDMSTPGPLARSAADLALLLPLLAGADGVDPFAHSTPVRDAASVGFAGRRVAGAVVVEAQPPPLDEVTDLAFRMMAADGGAQARLDLGAAEGRHVEQVTWLLENLASYAASADEFFALVRRWRDLRGAVRGFVAEHDLVVCPVVAGPAPLHGRRPGDDGDLEDYTAFSYVQTYSIAGLPVAVAPAGGENGLPIGVQLVAPYGRDDVALAAAAVIEAVLAEALPAPPAL